MGLFLALLPFARVLYFDVGISSYIKGKKKPTTYVVAGIDEQILRVRGVCDAMDDMSISSREMQYCAVMRRHWHHR